MDVSECGSRRSGRSPCCRSGSFPLRESAPTQRAAVLLPLAVLAGVVAVWALLSSLRVYHESTFPSPWPVPRAFREEASSKRLFDDMVASLFRVSAGFLMAVGVTVPLGLLLGP